MQSQETKRQTSHKFKNYYQRSTQQDQIFEQLKLSKTQHPDLSTKYEGYMQIAKRKVGSTTPQQYFSSPFLKELKQKRNNMFSDQIIQKMTKQYAIKQYGSFIDSKCYLPTNSKCDKYGNIDLITYDEIQRKMTKG